MCDYMFENQVIVNNLGRGCLNFGFLSRFCLLSIGIYRILFLEPIAKLLLVIGMFVFCSY